MLWARVKALLRFRADDAMKGHPLRLYATVLGCLTPGMVNVTLRWHPTVPFDSPSLVPIDLVPIDLRIPNSKFIVFYDPGGRPERIQRYDAAADEGPEQD